MTTGYNPKEDINAVCRNCGKKYGDHFGSRCTHDGSGTVFVKLRKKAVGAPAVWDRTRGTKGG